MASRKMKKSGKIHPINGGNSPLAALAKDDTSDGFKKGGKVKAKEAGKVEGGMPMPRADKRKRFARGGRTPFSSGHTLSGEASGSAGEGKESTRPK